MAKQENRDMTLRLPDAATREILRAMLDSAIRAARTEPKNAVPHYNKAALLLGLGRIEEALEAADEAVLAEPKSVDAHIVRSIILCSLGRMVEALQSCERAIELDPARADALNNKGSVLLDMGCHEEAAKEMKKATDIDPKNADLHVNYGIVLYHLGRYDEAIRSLRRSTSIRHNDATVWFYIGALLLKTGKMEKSLSAIETAIKLRPSYAQAHHAKGILLHRLGRREEADASFEKAHDLDPAFEAPVLPDEMDDIYLAWHEAMDTRNRLASPTSPRYVTRNQIRSRIAEFLNAAKRVLEYHAEQHKSGIVDDYLGLESTVKKYLQHVNTTKHERLLDVRITKTGKRKRVYPDTHTGQPMITIEEGAKLVRDGKSHGIDTWPDDMFKGDIDRGFVYEEQVCHVVLEDGEVELVGFLDTILGGVKELLKKHGYDTSVLSDARAYYGES